MISTLRNKKKLTAFALWFVIAAFVGTIFFVWGMGDKTAEANLAVEVDGVKISTTDFQQKVESTRENFRRLFGNNVDQLLKNDTIEKTVMSQVINEALLTNEAKRLKIPVSDAEVASYIQSMQAFQTDGKFDKERYTELLSRNRMTPQIFEASVRSDITVQKMTEIIKKSVTVSDAEIMNEYNYRNTQAVVSFIEFSADDALSGVKYTDADIAKYYDEHKDDYRVPQKADFKAVVFDPATYVPDIKVTDAEIEAYFIKNKEALSQPEEVKASHILIKVSDFKNDKEANEKFQLAKKVLAEIKAGADFAEEAKKYSEDGSASNGGDLGYFPKGQMVVPFETAAFALKTGEVSDIVKTQYGFHIIKVTDRKEATNPTIDQVRDVVIEAIKQEKGQASFRTAVYDKYKEIVNASNISAYNEKSEQKLPVAEIKGITETGEGTPLAAMPDVLKKIMNLNKTEISQLIDLGNKKMIFEMTEKYESYIPKLDDIKANVTDDYKAVKSLEAMKATAKVYLSSASVKDASDKSGKVFSVSPAFIRSEPIAGLGMNNELMDSIFSSKPVSFLKEPYVLGRKVYLVQVDSLTKPAQDKLSEQKDQISSALLGVKSAEALKDYINALKKEAVIKASPRYQQYMQ
ncbi:MAG: SurA N-terminal domain-containing protein [Deferribacterales bacterium]